MVNYQFKEFKKFASFLLEDQSLLKELAEDYLEQMRICQLPKMQFLFQLPSLQSLTLIQRSFKLFLEQCLEDTVFESGLVKVNNWVDHDSYWSSKAEMEKYDVLRDYVIRKQLIIKSLSKFTQDLSAFSCIVQELEEFQSFIDEYAFTEGKFHVKEGGAATLTQNEKEKEESLHIFDALPVLLGFIKMDKTFGFVNKAFTDFFHLKKEEVVGQGIEKVLGEVVGQDQVPFLEKALKGEFVTIESKGEVLGSRKWFRLSFVPKKLKDAVEGIFLLLEDITELKDKQIEKEVELQKLKEALQELERKNIDIQKINNDLNSFVYIASHDLRTPVTNIDGLLQILRERFIERADAEEAGMLKMTELAVGRLKRTIGDLLEVIKKQKGESNEIGEDGEVQFPHVIREVKEDIHGLIVQNQALIVEDLQVEKIFYKRASLRSIIYNLLSNAVKYGSPDRPLLLEVTTFQQGNYVVLSVKDNGLGLSIDQLKNLFSLFNRMHQHQEGIGIGLYSVKKMVESSGGKISVKSEEGKGSEFLVYLPVR